MRIVITFVDGNTTAFKNLKSVEVIDGVRRDEIKITSEDSEDTIYCCDIFKIEIVN